MTELENRIYEIVRKIPRGKVMTYGQVAEAAGNKNLSRVVGNVMHKNPLPFYSLAISVGWEENRLFYPDLIEKDFLPVPCHRVVNASGRMGKNFGMGGPAIQEKMLASEGVEVVNGKIDIDRYKFVSPQKNIF